MELRKVIYSIKMPGFMLFDIDTTLLNTYGSQDGAAFNYHYQDKGYHPLLAFGGLTGNLMKAELRDGTQYCSKEASAFMRSLLEEFQEDFPDIPLYLRGDNGFDFSAVSSSSMIVNANRLQVHVLAYNIFNWFRRLALAAAAHIKKSSMKHLQTSKSYSHVCANNINRTLTVSKICRNTIGIVCPFFSCNRDSIPWQLCRSIINLTCRFHLAAP